MRAGRIAIIGLGVMIPDQITIQAARALSSCTAIFSIVQEPPELWLKGPGRKQIPVVNLLQLYKEGVPRTENYEKAADLIVSKVEPGASIGYVTYGNPTSFDSVSQSLLRHARDKAIECEIIPGVSSLDTITNDLGIDIAPGIQVFEATWMVSHGIAIRRDVQLLLMQVGAFGSLRATYCSRKDGSSLGELVAYLARFYPKDHISTLVRSTATEKYPSRLCLVPINELYNVSSVDLSGASLYIPAVRKAEPRQEINPG